MKLYSLFYQIFDENARLILCAYYSLLSDFSEIDDAKSAFEYFLYCSLSSFDISIVLFVLSFFSYFDSFNFVKKSLPI